MLELKIGRGRGGTRKSGQFRLLELKQSLAWNFTINVIKIIFFF